MNYLKQILAFSHRRKLLALRASSIALYYVLLERFNAVRFPPAMSISTGYLASELRVSVSTIRRCREELRDKGYIRFDQLTKDCIYYLNDWSCGNATKSLDYQPRGSDHFKESGVKKYENI